MCRQLLVCWFVKKVDATACRVGFDTGFRCDDACELDIGWVFSYAACAVDATAACELDVAWDTSGLRVVSWIYRVGFFDRGHFCVGAKDIVVGVSGLNPGETKINWYSVAQFANGAVNFVPAAVATTE